MSMVRITATAQVTRDLTVAELLDIVGHAEHVIPPSVDKASAHEVYGWLRSLSGGESDALDQWMFHELVESGEVNQYAKVARYDDCTVGRNEDVAWHKANCLYGKEIPDHD